MAVRPLLDSSGNPVPRCWVIEWYLPLHPDSPKGTKPKQRRKVYSDLSEAEAQQVYLQLRRKPGTPVGFDPTITTIATDWLQSYSIDISSGSVNDIEWALVSILKHFGSHRLSSLTLPLFEQYMKQRRATLWRPPIIGKKDPDKVYKPGKPIGKSRINTELKYLGMMLKWATERGYMLRLPFDLPKYKRLPKKVVITPLPENVTKLLTKCDEKTSLAVMLYHDAGLRRTEGLQLCVEDVNLDEGFFVVKGKGDKERIVIIASDRLHSALEVRIEKVKTGHLFMNPKTKAPYKDLKKLIQSAAGRAELPPGMYNHLFRHAHATNSIEAGKELDALREDLGHANISTTQKYVHSRLGHRRKESAKLKAHIGK